MLALFVIIKANQINVYPGSVQVEDVPSLLGEGYSYVQDYVVISTPLLSFVRTNQYSLSSLEIPSLAGEEIDILQDAIDFLKVYAYLPSQSDPNQIVQGGNCQAFSLYLSHILDYYGIKYSFNLNDGLEHVSVLAYIGPKIYDIDLTRDTIIEREG